MNLVGAMPNHATCRRDFDGHVYSGDRQASDAGFVQTPPNWPPGPAPTDSGPSPPGRGVGVVIGGKTRKTVEGRKPGTLLDGRYLLNESRAISLATYG